jgi:hypothetical protein
MPYRTSEVSLPASDKLHVAEVPAAGRTTWPAPDQSHSLLLHQPACIGQAGLTQSAGGCDVQGRAWS